MVSTHIRKDLFSRVSRLRLEGELGKIMNGMLEEYLDEAEAAIDAARKGE